MNEYQKELLKLMDTFTLNSPKFIRNNPNLLPAIYQNDNNPNDPETDRLTECFAYMMSQSNVNFLETSSVMAINDLSNFLPEWFEPTVSSTILKANISSNHIWNEKEFPEKTLFSSFINKNKNEISFSNELPINILPIDIFESYFSHENEKYCLIFKIKSFADINQLGKVNIFFDYSKFSNFYLFLDDIFFTDNKIYIQKNNNKEYLFLDRKCITYSFKDTFDLSIYNENNYTYYLYQLVNYLNNYTFININFSNLNINLNKNDEIKIIIPLKKYFSETLTISNFIHTNCFVVKNKNIRRGDPIYLKKGEIPFLTLDRASKKSFIDIERILFFCTKNHAIIPLTINKDYRIYKKFEKTKNSIDIIYYLKIITPINMDLIILPYFHYSDLSVANNIPVKAQFFLKKDSKYIFENMTIPTKAIFYLDKFNKYKFYSDIFSMNSNLMHENLKIQNIFNILNFFSDISLTYKGIMFKITNQLKITNESNESNLISNAYGSFHQKRYHVSLKHDDNSHKIGGISILIHFLETILNKTSKLNAKYTLEFRSNQ